MKKSSKKVLEAAYKLVEDWAASYKSVADVNINPFLEALKQYDEQEFFAHYGLGIDRALAQIRKEKSV
jgi:predicted SpoU family rRNA methylase